MLKKIYKLNAILGWKINYIKLPFYRNSLCFRFFPKRLISSVNVLKFNGFAMC